MPNRKYAVNKITIFLLISFVYWLEFFVFISGDYISLGGDSYQYIILARSLAHGIGYRAVNYPSVPFFSHYPPLFPSFLVPAVFLGNSFLHFKIAVALAGFAAVGIIFLFFSRTMKLSQAAAISLLVVTNPYFLHYALSDILSDVPFLAFSFAAIFFTYLYLKDRRVFTSYGILTVLFLSAAFFIRYIGIVLIISMMLSIFFYAKDSKYKKLIFVGAPAACFIFMWLLIVLLYPHSSLSRAGIFGLNPYSASSGTIFQHPFLFLRRLGNNLFYYLDMFTQLILPLKVKMLSFGQKLLKFLIFILVAGGIVLNRKEKTHFLNSYFLLYLAVIVFWPYQEGVRFLIPIIPLIYAYLIIFTSKYVKSLSFKVILLVLLLFTNTASLPAARPLSFGKLPSALRNFFMINVWAKDNLLSPAVIVSRKPRITYFYSGHKSVAYPFLNEPDVIWRFFRKYNAKYLIVDNFSRETHMYIAPFLQRYRARLKLIYRIGNTGLFKIE